MRILWNKTDYGQFGFHVELDEYDASPPVDSLLIDHEPKSLNHERLAVAAYLAFGDWASGDLILPKKLGPNTAGAIERDLRHIPIRPGPVEYYPKALESGTRHAKVSFSFPREDIQGPSIAVLPASAWNGALRSTDSIVVASNALSLDRARPAAPGSIRARLAVAVLFAGDLSVDVISIAQEVPLPEGEIKRLENLLSAVRLGFESTNDPENR